MPAVVIDGEPFEVDEGLNLLEACLSLGFDLPYFCWHPALGSVGACRQCAVKQFRNESDLEGRIVIACMTPAIDGTLLSIQDPEATAFRQTIIEWLMLNHPHDCPVCDEGGECHLQDVTVMTGHAYRRSRFAKRTFNNQYLGPFLHHEMNRCIECYRCVRFYRDYAGGRDLDVFASHDHVYFGRQSDGVLESEFSGNLVEVCPTGVFTDKTLRRHYTRKWDLQTAPSLCIHCGLGCNTIAGERDGRLRRILNRYHRDINGYFLCDRGRFGYEFVNSSARIRQAESRSREATAAAPLDRESALRYVASIAPDTDRMVGIGSPRASLESNWALRRLVGKRRFHLGVSEREHRLLSRLIAMARGAPSAVASLRDLEESDAVFILGEDVPNVAPRMALSLRQSIRQKPIELADLKGVPRWHDAAVRDVVQEAKGPIFIATPFLTRLDDIATETYRAAPQDIARLGFAVAEHLDSGAPRVDGLQQGVRRLAESIARALRDAKQPAVVCGVSTGSESVLEAAGNVVRALAESGAGCRIGFVIPEANSLGLALLDGNSLHEAFRTVANGEADTILVVENDLYRRAPRRDVEALLERARRVIVVDSIDHETARRADIVLPAATFADGSGTLVNHEMRAQRHFAVTPPRADVRESWRWIRDISLSWSPKPVDSWRGLDDLLDELARDRPELAAVAQAAPVARFRLADQEVPRQPQRYSGRTAMRAQHDVHEQPPPEDLDSPLRFSMEGYRRQPPSTLVPRFWAPRWNSVQSLNKFQAEIGGELRFEQPGSRLIEGNGDGIPYSREIPPPFERSEDELLIVPLYHVFGSEELSALAPAVAERCTEPYLTLAAEDASRLGVVDGDKVGLDLSRDRHELCVVVSESLVPGLAGLPVGLTAFQGVDLPAKGRVRRSV